jgi:ABC-type branched-subunit amino acid transport system ATPase component
LAEIQRNWNRCTSKYKSTLIRTLLGHVARRDGHITLFGKDASRFKPHEVDRLGVAYVPEGRGVFPKKCLQHSWNVRRQLLFL